MTIGVNMKKIISITAFIVFSAWIVSAQINLDPGHDFYKSVQSWENRGLVSGVSPVRPYALSDIKNILKSVIEGNASEIDKEIAEYYWNEATGKPWNVSLEVEGVYRNRDDDKGNLIDLSPEVRGLAGFMDSEISLGYQIGFSVRNRFDKGLYLPDYANYSTDARFDPASVGNFGIYLNVNTIASFSKNGLTVQAGVFREGYGDFIGEGVALNDSAFHKPTVSLSYMNRLFSYTQQMSMLGATLSSFSRNSPKSTKVLSFHAFELKPAKWFSASFYETSMFGNRFDFSYLLPVPYMAAQSFSGYADSIMMGIRFKLIPFRNFAFKTDILVDDLAVNDIVKLNFDSKNRISMIAGIEYTPEPKFLERVGLNYLAVTPYTYTHWDVDDFATNEITANTINYQEYTNCGYTIGTTVPPNSQQVKLSVDLRPAKNLKINMFGAFTVHGNITETLTEEEQFSYLLCDENVFNTDGGIHTNPWGYNAEEDKFEYMSSAWNYMNFLKQEHLMYNIQTGISGSYEFARTKFGAVKINAGYVFEYIRNKGVDSNIFPGGKLSYDENTKIYLYEGGTSVSKSEIVNYYKEKWISSFTNQFNNYFSLSLEYVY